MSHLNPKTFRPINNNILIKRLQPMRVGKIIIPDQTIQKSFYAIIIRVGEKVKDTGLVPDRIIFVTPTSRHNQKLDNFHWIIKEQDIIAIKYGEVIRPFGNRIFLKRLNQETKIGNIIIPDMHETADQSLMGIFVLRGIKNNEPIDVPFLAGEHIKILKWSMNIVEIDIDGEYFLSVKTSELDYVEHN